MVSYSSRLEIDPYELRRKTLKPKGTYGEMLADHRVMCFATSFQLRHGINLSGHLLTYQLFVHKLMSISAVSLFSVQSRLAISNLQNNSSALSVARISNQNHPLQSLLLGHASKTNLFISGEGQRAYPTAAWIPSYISKRGLRRRWRRNRRRRRRCWWRGCQR